MKRLIVDMDDVLADATGQFIKYYEKEFGIRVERSVLNNKNEGEGFPDNHAILKQFPRTVNFFRDMIPNENSQEVMEKLNKKYEVFIVSAAMQFPQSLPEKLEWLTKYFPFLSWKQFVFCGSKTVVYGDYMIDDLPHNLEHFNGEKYLFTAPHNMHISQFNRFENWKDIESKLL